MTGVSKPICTCSWEAGSEASLFRWNYYSETPKISSTRSSAQNVPRTSDWQALAHGQTSRDSKSSCGLRILADLWKEVPRNNTSENTHLPDPGLWDSRIAAAQMALWQVIFKLCGVSEPPARIRSRIFPRVPALGPAMAAGIKARTSYCMPKPLPH